MKVHIRCLRRAEFRLAPYWLNVALYIHSYKAAKYYIRTTRIPLVKGPRKMYVNTMYVSTLF